jgi:peptidoglycan/LPS O-acetylase OafA/YrhL
MRRVIELDSLRGLAALMIVFYHLWFLTITALGTAVDLFFVLSGYLITTIILEHQGTPGFLVNFYVRRSLRIWPIYYLALLAVVVLNPFLHAPARLDGLPYYLTYTQKMPHYWSGIEPAFSPAFFHTWSLAIEEQFYVIWPALLCLLGRQCLVPLVGAFVVTGLVARAHGMNYWLLITHCDGLALGGLLGGILLDRERVGRRARTYGFAFAGVMLAALSFPAWGGRLIAAAGAAGESSHLLPSVKVFFINLGYFGIGGLTVVHAGQPVLGWLRERRLAHLGQISYGLYLYHPIVFLVWDNIATATGVGGGVWLDAAKLGSTFSVAAVSWVFVEQPILALKDRFEYRPRPMARQAIGGELPSLDTAA